MASLNQPDPNLLLLGLDIILNILDSQRSLIGQALEGGLGAT